MSRVARIERPHDDLETDYHEWVHLGRSVDREYRTKDGKKRAGRSGWWPWLRYVCNNPDCTGVAWVQAAAIETYAATLIDAVRPPVPRGKRRAFLARGFNEGTATESREAR